MRNDLFSYRLQHFVSNDISGGFFWAIKSGQNDDTFTPAVRILFDDEMIEKEQRNK
ncbi:cbb3-type cytochrome oxidase assembly protein [Pedobacter steynii]